MIPEEYAGIILCEAFFVLAGIITFMAGVMRIVRAIERNNNQSGGGQ